MATKNFMFLISEHSGLAVAFFTFWNADCRKSAFFKKLFELLKASNYDIFWFIWIKNILNLLIIIKISKKKFLSLISLRGEKREFSIFWRIGKSELLDEFFFFCALKVCHTIGYHTEINLKKVLCFYTFFTWPFTFSLIKNGQNTDLTPDFWN